MMPSSAKRMLERVCLGASTNARGPVLHNLDTPLVEQLGAGRPPRVQRVDVVSPWHSSVGGTDGVEPMVLAKLNHALGASPRVFTQGHDRQAPPLGKSIEVRVLRSSAFGGEEDLDSGSDDSVVARPRRPARLHAKAYVAVGSSAATLWFGSANCTLPALCRATGQGNVELLARVALDRKSLARLDADLETMFERPTGVVTAQKPPRVAAPGGFILAGYVDDWEHAPRLTIELATPARATRLRVGLTPRHGGALEIAVLRGAVAVNVPVNQCRRLFQSREVPPLLWEHVDGTAIPFPLSVPCTPAMSGDPEVALQDVLDDLAGRVPLPFQTRRCSSDQLSDDDDDDDESDRELELLTECEHEGLLDRMAVRIELLRRRISASGGLRSHYIGIVERLPVVEPVRRALVEHLRRSSK
jgi:hypothetical protein